MFAPKHIMVPTDFSASSDDALRFAAGIARQYQAKIYLIHVVDERFSRGCGEDYCLSGEMLRQVEMDSLKAARDRMVQEQDRFAKDVSISFDIKIGIPSEVILAEQEEKGIDLIIIASRGKSAILRYFLGSVAKRVISRAKCSVLVVRA